MDQKEFENDIKIDVNALDVECARQPEITYKWAQRLIEARAACDRAKRRLDFTEAQLQLEIRDCPSKFEITRVTEKTVECAVVLHADFTTAWEKLAAAKELVIYMTQAVNTLDMKKKQLENLIQLHGLQYFAGPSTPRNLGEIWQHHQDRSEQKINRRVLSRVRKKRKKRTNDE